MKNTKDYTQEILRRSNEKIQNRKRKQRIAVTLCMCLAICAVAGGAFALPKLINNSSENSSGSQVTESSSIVQDNTDNGNTAGTDDIPFFSGADVGSDEVILDDKPVIWGDSVGSSEDYGICEWHGKSVSIRLYDELEKNDENVLFAVSPTNFNINNDFVYNGKTLSQYAADRENEYLAFNKLGMILKEGDSLRYGELLYKGGAPNGEKWAESFYHERVEMYGEEFLATYIVDGEFLKDKVEQDLDAMSDRTASKLYDEAVEAYRLHTIKELAKALDEQGIRYEMIKNYLVMYVTETELAQLSLSQPSQWHFCLAVDLGQPQDMETPVIDLYNM